MLKKEKENSTNNIENVIENTFSHLSDIVDANTVVGNIIAINDNNYIVPVSKISVGMISGGGTIPKQKGENVNACSGTGFNITPIGFVAVVNNEIKFLSVNTTNDLSKNILDLLYKVYDNLSAIEVEKNEKEK